MNVPYFISQREPEKIGLAQPHQWIFDIHITWILKMEDVQLASVNL